MNLCKPSVIKELMEEAGIFFRKEYGQNFLIDPNVPEEIADYCTDDPHSCILEIGPGVGCLTSSLAQRYDRVVAVEIDHGLIPVLNKTLAEYDNVTVIEGDIMKTDLSEIAEKYAHGMPLCVCANLPYYITTPILMYLIESGVPISSITVMVQNEVASRLCSGAGDSDWGAITAVISYYGSCRRLFRVPAGSFMPAPKVDSAVVRIDLDKEKKYHPKREDKFFSLIHAAFAMRRKTFVNSVCATLPITKEALLGALEKLGMDTNIRGEKITLDQFVEISDLLFD